MQRPYVTRATLLEFVALLGATFDRPGRLYMVGATTQVFEGWREWMAQVEFTAAVAADDRPAFDHALSGLQAQLGVRVIDESPGEVIPLPAGYEARARPAAAMAEGPAGTPDSKLQLYHFDPYSVAFLQIARGDEDDYRSVLTFLEHGWLVEAEMNTLLDGLLPRFTFETIQQDPAEFRRRYKGLLQMWHAKQQSKTS